MLDSFIAVTALRPAGHVRNSSPAECLPPTGDDAIGYLHSGTAEAAGSWPLDGLLPIDQIKELLRLTDLPEHKLGNYHSVIWFVIVQISRIPKKVKTFAWGRNQGHGKEARQRDPSNPVGCVIDTAIWSIPQ